MSQIALPLDWPEGSEERDFIVTPANEPIVRHFQHWSLWPVMATMLTGPRKSGRSLLGRIVAAQTGGELIDPGEDADEEAIFHAWNRAQGQRRPLIIVVDAPPPAWDIALPDLRSRMMATPVVAMPEPDEALASMLIEKLCHLRGLAASPELIRYVVPRIERSFLGIHRTMDALDELALQRRQALTVPLARRALITLGVIDESQAGG
ncbi:chromosomal replication initiator DnaA [Sphingomonas sp. BIUV-7]|uniref:Chromosomal replication initiator DnaA n=1 Tax=Sphingomonas natans TaxID=3063330 RepID=A0ABT8YAC4_9SPHN|nr:chromosomal replication initiator DnaA [Sphingomonas sp. BIUV-7]MDO6414659.1 chromosomal replication initiator DnaA [Sphingomonas sp. BIUV-7]